MKAVDDSDAFETAARAHFDNFAKRRLYENEATPLQDYDVEIQLFLQHLLGKEMLDAGCGWGRNVFRFLDEELTYRGIDHSTEMLKRAQEINPGASFQTGSFRTLPFASNQFNGIWCCDAFATTPKVQMQLILKEFKRILKPGGIIMIVMPLLGYSNEEIPKAEHSSGIKISTYLPMELSSHVRVAGFTIIKANDEPKRSTMYVLAKKETA